MGVYSYLGGCHPPLTHRRRTSTITGLFVFSTTMVPQPVKIKLTRNAPDSTHSTKNVHPKFVGVDETTESFGRCLGPEQ